MRIDEGVKGSRAVDPRPARTRESILAAIERLGALDAELTVAAIVTEAQIARSSFYAQFRDLGDVAVQLIRDVHVHIERLDAEIRRNGTGYDAAHAATKVLVDEFQRRRVLYQAVLGAKVSHGAQQEIHRIMANAILPSVRTEAPAGVSPSFAASYVAGGVLAVLRDWLVAAEPTSPADLRSQLEAMLPAWLRSDQPSRSEVGSPGALPE